MITPGLMIKNVSAKAIMGFAFVLFGFNDAFSQHDSLKLDELSLKDLLNVKIVSVSRNPELLFEAPLSASVLTREEIRRSGSTSIMEALRLIPGMIVREQSNGNYDIHIRGMDNVPPNASFDIASTTMLVMIDNRPIYSYLRGGTFWETLPVDINDVEKIEVIRGPAAALYGPNAVNGVINIITRQLNKEGLYLVANAQKGSYRTTVNNASIGYKSGKWGMIASGNYQGRDRTQTSYYEFNRNQWLDNPAYFLSFSGDTVTNVSQRYPQKDLAMKKYAGNVFLHYDAAEKVKFNLSAGAQHSMVQKVSSENEITPLSTASSDSRYMDLRANMQNVSAQLSYNSGTQVVDYDPVNKYDFRTFDGNIEYTYTNGNLSIKPALSYRSALYDDTRYADIKIRNGIFNNKGIITTQSASLRGDYKMMDNKLRLVAGLTASKFNYPDATYMSYELAATYKIKKKHLLRIVYSRAPRSSNIFDTYADQAIALFPTGNNNYTEIALLGNKNLQLLTANMFEAGYRGSISKRLNIDAEIFEIHAKNFNVAVQSRDITENDGTNTIHETPIIVTNLPLIFVQRGMTISVSYNAKMLQVKPFVTAQQTRIRNYAPSINTADANIPGAAQNNIYSAMGAETVTKSTPAVFGGAYINYTPVPKININLSAYYYTGQTYYHLSNILFNDGVRGVDHIPAKLIVNTSVSYQPVKSLHIFCTGKNLLNNKSREFFHADAVPFALITGVNFAL